MRSERWYWLVVFCTVSIGIHWLLLMNSRSFGYKGPVLKPAEIEVALEPLKEPTPPPKPVVKEKPKPLPKTEPKHVVKPAVLVARKASPVPKPVTVASIATPTVKDIVPVHEKAPIVERHEQPILPTNVTRAKAPTDVRPVTPDIGGLPDKLKKETPLTLGSPIARKDAGSPRRIASVRPDLFVGGGGAPAPAIIPGGHGGARGPEAPPEDVNFNGGGRGGENLPKEAPRIGGGGGRHIMSVENPLAKDTIPEERPGLGPGVGSGEGNGRSGGVGSGRGKGIGTNLNGKLAVASLRSKPGAGIGAGEGNKIGTRPPGGGHGTGSELPGTGGDGLGYGRGKGTGIGNGNGFGEGDGNGGSRTGTGDGGVRVASNRGIPFGDVTGLLLGDPNGGRGHGGGPGGVGRGAIFSPRPVSAGGGGGRLRIVYALDISGSMRDGNKIGKAQDALRKALSELRPYDSFNIVTFRRDVFKMADGLLPATVQNIQKGLDYINHIEIGDGTNLSGALDLALSMPGATHIFVASDGEPNGGISDFGELRKFVISRNSAKVRILTLAIGQGEQFKGMALLKGVAEDNNGTFSYVNVQLIK